jgi:hypothetical protein
LNPPSDQPIPPDPNRLSVGNNPDAIDAPPVITDTVPARKSPFWRQLVAFVLSLCLGLFLAGAVVSLLDDSLVLLLGLHRLTAVSGILGCLSYLLVTLVYVLMGLTPVIPKRVVLPIVMYIGLALLAVFPVLIYHREWMIQMDWLLSLGQVLLGLGLLFWLQGGFKFRWPIVEANQLGKRAFSWVNLSVFLLLNIFVLTPAIAAYLAFCANLALGHYTDGFVALRPAGLTLQARKYVRDDGKTILLFPMSHIAESDFYKSVSQSVSSNSVVLLEGVSDAKGLLTNGISYRRAAKSLGLAEQHDALVIRKGELVRADVDVQEFSPVTVDILNLVALVHARGLDINTLLMLLQFSPPPDAEQQLFADILLKRNEHLLQVLRERLPESDDFIIPWGAVHMPGIAKEIQKAGFHLMETREYVSIRFGRKRHSAAQPQPKRMEDGR